MRLLAALLITLPLVTALSTPALAGIGVFPDRGCPASAAIEATLERLGALRRLGQLGSAEVRLEETRMLISFRDRGGEYLGLRVVDAGSDCEARASLAAAVIAAFAGEWSETQLADPSRPAQPETDSEEEAEASPDPATAKPVESASQTASAPLPSLPFGSELGVVGLGMHDGNATALGAGGRLDFTVGPWVFTGLVEASTERSRELGSGEAAYASQRGGLGIGLRQEGASLFWDLSLMPMIERLSLSGRNVDAGRSTSAWDFALGGDVRFGWRGRRWRPFLLLGASTTIPPQRMALSESDLWVTVSAFNARVGLGISYVMAP
jgi:hypothetical protein